MNLPGANLVPVISDNEKGDKLFVAASFSLPRLSGDGKLEHSGPELVDASSVVYQKKKDNGSRLREERNLKKEGRPALKILIGNYWFTLKISDTCLLGPNAFIVSKRNITKHSRFEPVTLVAVWGHGTDRCLRVLCFTLFTPRSKIQCCRSGFCSKKRCAGDSDLFIFSTKKIIRTVCETGIM